LLFVTRQLCDDSGFNVSFHLGRHSFLPGVRPYVVSVSEESEPELHAAIDDQIVFVVCGENVVSRPPDDISRELKRAGCGATDRAVKGSSRNLPFVVLQRVKAGADHLVLYGFHRILNYGSGGANFVSLHPGLFFCVGLEPGTLVSLSVQVLMICRGVARSWLDAGAGLGKEGEDGDRGGNHGITKMFVFKN
jgi:hypothetical protein